jgi:hypothetical protein
LFNADGLVDFEATRHYKGQIKAFKFVEERDMVMADLLLFDPAFSHRCQTKDQLEEDSTDKVKVGLVTTDTFARLEDCLGANKGDPSRYVYSLAPSKRLDEDIGRLYDTRFVSFMYMSKRIRNPLYRNMVECDQKSAHPRTFVELYKCLFSKTPGTIMKIINNKDKLYPDLAREMQCSVPEIKKMVNATLYGCRSLDAVFGKGHGRPNPPILHAGCEQGALLRHLRLWSPTDCDYCSSV